jgi:hypothetical protein
MLRPSYRLRRLLTIVAASLVLGVAIHTTFQAIEHHEGITDAVALCAAAVALIATLRLGAGGRTRRRSLPVVWVALTTLTPGAILAVAPRSSSAWLQRFLN